ncbi:MULTISPECIES: bifunctional lysylphosphatidylglycerol flippase/synthetase MprF [Enterococcus]|uniref:bifunctional lysylphosphatidylglycerol flippase/synthetase MprF n=1 Tax=Enterococcus TaxID=1350 RepID=UPI00065E3E51|nr:MULTISPECIES: bifunctional lysylphosphatidylglycerol flippase/synthetase MprF [Enterococcus]KAF1300842.1 hypothetical protein BAU16_10690 [Enterococcus sp. JM9B]
MRSVVQKGLQWVKAHSFLLRLIFFGSIILFVSNQVINIAHGMSWDDVLTTMDEQNNSTLVLMGIIGLVGIIPMLGYDWVTIQTLETLGKPKMPRKDWLIAAWTTNTINNLAGFGGIIGASLRANFYGKGIDRKKILATVSKIALFMLSGLSIWALFLLVALFTFHGDAFYQKYWIWLLGGSLYAPSLLIFSYLRRKKLFAELYPKGVLTLLATSFTQWLSALAVFLSIGYLMELPISLVDVAPMFLIATLIGMLTMVPGGMGTFDVLMILGMSQIGLSQDQTVVWLLYYRLFYYLVPFLSGVILFLTQTSVKLNRFFDNLPRIFLQRIAHIVVVVAVYFAGIMMVLLSTVTNLSNISRFFEFILPFSFNFLDQTLNLLIGFLLLGLARALFAKVKRAYFPTIALLLFGIINTISRTRSLRLMVVYLLILATVWLARHEFYREKFVYSWGAKIFDGCLFGCLFIVYAVAGYHSGQWWNNQILGDNFFLFPSDDVWFSGLLGVAISLMTLLGLQQYLAFTEKKLGTSWDEKRFAALIQRFGGTRSSHRLFLPGYQYYYYQKDGQDELVFGYQIKGNRCFVLGRPIGNEKLWGEATLAFISEADLLGYQLAFYRISQRYAVLLHDLGFQFTKIGESATVSLRDKSFDSSKSFERQEYHFTYYEQLPEELVADVQRVSEEWLKGNKEKFFGSGRFTKEYLLKSPIGILRKKTQVVGFITQQPIDRNWVSYDLLRMLPEEPPELANYLVVNMLKEWQAQGYELADLGMAPFAHVGDGPFASIEERIMNVIYNYGTFYGFQRNVAGKQRYVEDWESCYFAYVKGGNFYLASLQLLLLIGKGKNKGPTLVEDVMLDV